MSTVCRRVYAKDFVFAVFAVVLALQASACLQVGDVSDVEADGRGCDFCHSSSGDSPAHESHVNGGLIGEPMDCDACHPVPADWFTSDHPDAKVQVVFAAESLANTGGLEPEWDGTQCRNVYCHGASLRDGRKSEPLWQDGRGSGNTPSCEACHGNPPSDIQTPDMKPCNQNCPECHPGTFVEEGFVKHPNHIDGEVKWTSASGEGDGEEQ